MKKKYLSMAVATALVLSTSSVMAADAVNMGDENVVVTATRTNKKDVNVPAATEVITAKKIAESGAQSAIDVLKTVNGIQYDSLGAGNSNQGTMTNDVIIRGYKDSTLVLVNGVPISYRTKYDLSSIDAKNIERIEIIKSGGSVLYGSEAIGGVINIITKKDTPQKSFTVGIGNRDGYHYDVATGEENWRFFYSKNVMGKKHDVSSPGTADKAEVRYIAKDIAKQNMNFTISPTDNWDITYNYSELTSTHDRDIYALKSGYSGTAGVGDLYQTRRYETVNHNIQALFQDANWKVTLFNNLNFIESRGITPKVSFAKTVYHTRERNNTYGVDGQNTWKLNEKSFLTAGFNAKRESYNSYPTEYTKVKTNFDRNNWAVFAELDQKLDAKNSIIIGGRETWTTGAFDNKNYSNFSMSGSWLHQMNEENNVYVTVAQSFRMPAFSEMYKSTNMAQPNPDLKPQKGINYELGWKQNHGNHSWKAALFHMEVKNNISAVWTDKTATGGDKFYQYYNTDFHNNGIELSCAIDTGKKFSFGYGVTYQDPQSKNEQKNLGWEHVYGKLQLNGNLTYKVSKLTAGMNLSYMSNRYQSQSKQNQPVKPYFITSMNLVYAPDKTNEFSIAVDNLLSRRDRTSNSSSDYFCTPTTIMFNYTYKF